MTMWVFFWKKCPKWSLNFFTNKIIFRLLMLIKFATMKYPTLLPIFNRFAELAKINNNLIDLVLYFFGSNLSFFKLITIELYFIEERTYQELELIFFHYHEFVPIFFHFFLHLCYTFEFIIHFFLISL